jgi:hypothetical protein
MIQINIGDHLGSENGVPFTPIPTRFLSQVRWARERAIAIARGNPGANAYFRSLSRHRTLSALLADSSTWINYDPTLSVSGATFHNKDLWIGPSAFAVGRWTVLATLVHELAHIGGAGGGATGLVCTSFSGACHAAERAVLECGLGNRNEIRTGRDDPRTPYDPTIVG